MMIGNTVSIHRIMHLIVYSYDHAFMSMTDYYVARHCTLDQSFGLSGGLRRGERWLMLCHDVHRTREPWHPTPYSHPDSLADTSTDTAW